MVLPPEISNAARARDMDAVRQFVESNPERINESFEHVGDGEGLNLLTVAIGRHTSIEMVRYLISRGADVERRNSNITPLYGSLEVQVAFLSRPGSRKGGGVRAYAAPHRLAAHASDAARNCLERACFLEPAPRVRYCIRMSNCTSKILSECSSTPLIEGFRFPH